MEIYDGIQRKKRTIIVPSFIEQIIHHMAVNVLKPIFMESMYEHSYGSIPKRGPHKAKRYISKAIRKGKNIKYCLKMDIKKYFDSIPHIFIEIRLRKLIRDQRFLDILLEILNVTEVGIPLGFYTSQWIANWYLTPLDHFIKEKLKAPLYYRYMDDMVIFSDDKTRLHRIRQSISSYLVGMGLVLKRNYQVFRYSYFTNGDTEKGRPLDYMGFKFHPNRIILRRSIMIKATRKARRTSKLDRINVHVARQMLSYLGWIMHTDTYGMYLKTIKPYISFRQLKQKVSWFDKRQQNRREYDLVSCREYCAS